MRMILADGTVIEGTAAECEQFLARSRATPPPRAPRAPMWVDKTAETAAARAESARRDA